MKENYFYHYLNLSTTYALKQSIVYALDDLFKNEKFKKKIEINKFEEVIAELEIIKNNLVSQELNEKTFNFKINKINQIIDKIKILKLKNFENERFRNEELESLIF